MIPPLRERVISKHTQFLEGTRFDSDLSAT